MGGGDKTLMPVAGKPMLAHVLERLRPAHRFIVLSANGDAARFSAFGLPVVGDGAYLGAGPLAGILAGLRWAREVGTEALLVAPGDAPCLPHGLAARLEPAPGYAYAERAHPLVSLLPVSACGALEAWLEAGRSRAVLAFLEAVGARAVQFLHEAEFRNVNTPGDLAD